MAFTKGNKSASHDKPWTRALQRHVQQNPNLLRTLAIKTFEKAEQGDLSALKEITERLDGKAAQSIELSGSIETNRAEDVTDEQLAHIATTGSDGATQAQEGPQTTH